MAPAGLPTNKNLATALAVVQGSVVRICKQGADIRIKFRFVGIYQMPMFFHR